MKAIRSSMSVVMLCIALNTSAETEKCLKDATTTGDMELCVAMEVREENDRLKQMLTRMEKRLADQQQKDLLGVAEAAWERYREANCSFAADLYREGTIQGLVAQQCRARMVKERIKELELLLTDLH